MLCKVSQLLFVCAEMRTKSSIHRKVILDPHGEFLQKWNKVFLMSCAFTMASDALFFYIPVVDGANQCLTSDHTLVIIACVLRTITDVFYLGHIILQFRTAYVSPTSRGFGRGDLVEDVRLIAKRYLKTYFIVDVLAVLPFPQMVVTLPRFGGHGLTSKDMLKLVIFTQYAPRLFRVCPLYKQVTRSSGVITERAWAGAALNLLLYVLSSHVFGAVWYLFSIDRLSNCWHQSCIGQRCLNASLYCSDRRGEDYTFNKAYCSLTDPDQISKPTVFDFGMFYDAIHSEVVQSRKFCRKLSFCFWWGLRSISSFGQNFSPSDYVGENLFAAFICLSGLILFSFLFGNIQKYLDSTTAKVEEMRLRRQDSEKWMSHRSLPEELKKRIRKYDQYKWQETRGFDEETVISNLPRDLRTDIKRHLWNMCFNHIMRVPWFEGLNEEILDAMCDWLTPVLYMKNSFILREGQQVKEVLFIMRGRLTLMSADNGRSDFELSAGDFWGPELIEWAAVPTPASNLPISDRTIKFLTEVEAFALKPDDLTFVMRHMRKLHGPKFRYIFRFYSRQWRTWAANYIQAAWRRYKRRKLGNARFVEKAKEDALNALPASSSRLRPVIHASRFAAVALQKLRCKKPQPAEISQTATSSQSLSDGA